MVGGTLTFRTVAPFLAIILIGTLLSPFLGFARVGVLNTFRPVVVLNRTTSGLRRVFSSIRDIGTLRARVATLEAENATLKSEHITQTELVKEDQLAAKQQTSMATLNPGVTLTARVISRSPTLLLDSVTIDKGLADGVVAHDAVLVDGFFAGVIDTVAEHESQVLLITNPSLLIPVIFQTTRAQGLLRSSLAGLIVSEIPSSVTLPAQEVVLTNDIGHVVPHGLPIGTIDRTITTNSDILQRVRIQSPIAFHQLEYMLVLITPADKK